MATFWDERYSTEEYVFGKDPNVFFKSVIDTLPPGRIFVPAAGEGRDAVYAAERGWNVSALDLSTSGREKAMRLAAERNVTISYTVGSIEQEAWATQTYDAAALIYFHLPPMIRQEMFRTLITALQPNGTLIIEAFTPRQIGNGSGGPSDPELLLSKEILTAELGQLTIVQCEEVRIELAEGKGHAGKADVVRFVGTKK